MGYARKYVHPKIGREAARVLQVRGLSRQTLIPKVFQCHLPWFDTEVTLHKYGHQDGEILKFKLLCGNSCEHAH